MAVFLCKLLTLAIRDVILWVSSVLFDIVHYENILNMIPIAAGRQTYLEVNNVSD